MLNESFLQGECWGAVPLLLAGAYVSLFPGALGRGLTAPSLAQHPQTPREAPPKHPGAKRRESGGGFTPPLIAKHPVALRQAQDRLRGGKAALDGVVRLLLRCAARVTRRFSGPRPEWRHNRSKPDRVAASEEAWAYRGGSQPRTHVDSPRRSPAPHLRCAAGAGVRGRGDWGLPLRFARGASRGTRGEGKALPLPPVP